MGAGTVGAGALLSLSLAVATRRPPRTRTPGDCCCLLFVCFSWRVLVLFLCLVRSFYVRHRSLGISVFCWRRCPSSADALPKWFALSCICSCISSCSCTIYLFSFCFFFVCSASGLQLCTENKILRRLLLLRRKNKY